MSRGIKIGLIVGLMVLVAGGGVGAAVVKKKHKAVEVRLDRVAHRDLVAAVTASGKIDAEKTVDVSADITGRILQIAVKEGDTVQKAVPGPDRPRPVPGRRVPGGGPPRRQRGQR